MNLDIDDDNFDKIVSLLSETRFNSKKDYNKTLTAIEILEKNPIDGIDVFMRGLVYHSDLLKRYFNIVKFINDDDFSCMLSRCIERNLSDSLDILLLNKEKIKYHDENINNEKYITNPKLLIGKYDELNMELYNKAKNVGFPDIYYENSINNNYDIILMGPYDYEHIGKYGGYRYTYYSLLYKKNITNIIKYLEAYSFEKNKVSADCVIEACYDFLYNHKYIKNKKDLSTYILNNDEKNILINLINKI
jgi:hypothetical protein